MTEAELIERLRTQLSGTHPLAVQGIGDDAAVFEWDRERYGLLSVDVLHEHWDFDRVYHAARWIGYKAAASAISDICAMNGEPLFLLVAIGIPQAIPPSYLEEIYQGLRKVEEKYGVAVVGGRCVCFSCSLAKCDGGGASRESSDCLSSWRPPKRPTLRDR